MADAEITVHVEPPETPPAPESTPNEDATWLKTAILELTEAKGQLTERLTTLEAGLGTLAEQVAQALAALQSEVEDVQDETETIAEVIVEPEVIPESTELLAPLSETKGETQEAVIESQVVPESTKSEARYKIV